MLFNTYMSKLPLPLKGINITSYADDITLTTSHTQVEKMRDNNSIPKYFTRLARIKEVKLTAEKSSATVFTTWTKFDQHLTINNSPIPLKSKVKVLGVTFDSMLNFGEHEKHQREIIKAQ